VGEGRLNCREGENLELKLAQSMKLKSHRPIHVHALPPPATGAGCTVKNNQPDRAESGRESEKTSEFNDAPHRAGEISLVAKALIPFLTIEVYFLLNPIGRVE